MLDKVLKVMEEKALSPNAFFILYKDVIGGNILLHDKCELIQALTTLQNNKYIKITDYNFPYSYEIRPKGQSFIKSIDHSLKEVNITVKTTSKKVDEQLATEINEWINDYRNLFGTSQKLGIKGDKTACLEKMVRFFITYPEYANKDIVFKAATKYIDQEGVQNNYKYLQRADYFIFKQDQVKGETSRLYSFCEIVEEDSTTSFQGFTKVL